MSQSSDGFGVDTPISRSSHNILPVVLLPTMSSARSDVHMSVMVAHGEEEGKDGAHHQGHQLRLGEPSLAISAVRVTVAHICHLREYMDGGNVEEGASTEQHGSASPRQGVKVSLQGRISYVLYI